MKNKELLMRVGYVVLICLSFFLATRCFLENNKVITICWIGIGSEYVYDLVHRIKNSNKED